MLDLSSRGYGAHNIKSLVSLLKQNSDIKNLKLYRNNIDGEALELLVPALIALTNLEKLNLGYNDIDDDNIEKLSPLVNKGVLKHLVLSVNTEITNKSLQIVNSWRQKGLVVDVYHTKISENPIKTNIKEEQHLECSM